MTSIQLGDPAPDFSTPATGDKQIALTDFAGKTVILYFYPRDNTPGCTQEGQAFRDHYDEIQALNAVVLGVSRDSVKVHDKFKEKHNFPFDLLSDADETLCKAFDVIHEKNMYGKKVLGIVRSTFIFNEAGILAHEIRKVKVKDHLAEVMDILKS